jgi:hypothetical protein
MFRNKPHSRVEKIELLKKIENKSSREAQKIVFDLMPELKKPEVSFHNFDEDLRSKLEQIRGLLAHKEGDLTLVQLLHRLCDEKLARHFEAKRPKVPATSRVKKEVWERDQKCVNCGSMHALEVDHIVPKSAGGSDDPENLRLLCRSCNQRAAISYFGERKMGHYLKSRSVKYIGDGISKKGNSQRGSKLRRRIKVRLELTVRELQLRANEIRNLRRKAMRNANAVTFH